MIKGKEAASTRYKYLFSKFHNSVLSQCWWQIFRFSSEDSFFISFPGSFLWSLLGSLFKEHLKAEWNDIIVTCREDACYFHRQNLPRRLPRVPEAQSSIPLRKSSARIRDRGDFYSEIYKKKSPKSLQHRNHSGGGDKLTCGKFGVRMGGRHGVPIPAV